MVLFYILDLNDENTSASEQYFLLNIRKITKFLVSIFIGSREDIYHFKLSCIW